MSEAGRRPELERLNFYDEPFWEACRAGQFVLQQCRSCGHRMFPGGPICPKCWTDAPEWKPASGNGTVYSWMRMHRQYFDELPPPYRCVLVELEEGPLFITNFGVEGPGRDPVINEPVHIRIVDFENISLPIAFPVT